MSNRRLCLGLVQLQKGAAMSFKAIILLRRKDGLSREEFIRWWFDQHRPLALQLPGLRGMTINVSDNPDAAYDGVSELWFDTETAFKLAYETQIGQAVAADSLSMVSLRDRLLVTEHSYFSETS
jgi:uncharacterized protein (TIGR02118 family)